MAQPTLTYSIAIRTLGMAGDKFREELLSIARQTVQPQRVMAYIAEGYERPVFTVGREEYVWVRKGMMAQRILPYSDIGSDCLLMLDDDVKLADDTAERMLHAMEENKADCVGADTFRNHEMSARAKILAAITNLVFPHNDDRWAFKMHRNGRFSYINCPRKSFYWSQTCAGPAMMWRMETYHKLQLTDEFWLERLFSFTYGDDTLLSYKIYKNGLRLGVLFDSGVVNLDAGSSSGAFRKSKDRMYVRTVSSFTIWWRTCFKYGDTSFEEQLLTAICYAGKALWLFLVFAAVSLFRLRPRLLWQYITGLVDAWSYVHTAKFSLLPPYAFLKQ